MKSKNKKIHIPNHKWISFPLAFIFAFFTDSILMAILVIFIILLPFTFTEVNKELKLKNKQELQKLYDMCKKV